MDTLTELTPDQTTPRRPGRTWLIVFIGALVIAGIAVGTWAMIEANQTEDLAAATEFAEGWDVAVLSRDGGAAAALFTEDGAWNDWQGRDTIRAAVNTWAQFYTEMQHGALTELDDGVFTYPVTAVFRGRNWAGEMTITLEGDLVSYASLDWGQVD